MKIQKILSNAVAIGVMIMGTNSYASTFPNPDPGVYGPELNGRGYFTPSEGIFAIEFYDMVDIAPGATFGFYFEGADLTNSDNLIKIFDNSDNAGNCASISFSNNLVWDEEDAGYQDLSWAGDPRYTFNNPGGNIGFFMYIEGQYPLFTDPSLNPYGNDYAYAFPLILPFADIPTPQIMIAFAWESSPGQYTTLTSEFVGGITAVPIPLPGSIILLGSSLLGMFALKRKKSAT